MTEETKRLPSFNDFSPGILKDVRRPLEIVKKSNGNRATAVVEFANAFFNGVSNKRSTTNIPTTLTSLGLINSSTFTLTDVGEIVLNCGSKTKAAAELVRHVYTNLNGDLVVQAVKELENRAHSGDFKTVLKSQLKTLGVADLANATTDHTTLVNWMIEAEIVEKDGRCRRVNDHKLKALVGISASEYDELSLMDGGQRIFLRELSKLTRLEDTPVAVSHLINQCLAIAPHLYREDQFRQQIITPLEINGWIKTSNTTGGRGSKSGNVHATKKLKDIPVSFHAKTFEGALPQDLRKHLTMPFTEVLEYVNSDDKHKRGIGLELLSLRMLLDLGLEPVALRERSKVSTASAEIDLIAEGLHLHFSRWLVQCKHYKKSDNPVRLADLAKEVGMAIYLKAHVILIATTTRFTQDAINYAHSIQQSTHLQFVLIDGQTITKYTKHGPKALFEYVINNASDVMKSKKVQLEQGNQDVSANSV